MDKTHDGFCFLVHNPLTYSGCCLHMGLFFSDKVFNLANLANIDGAIYESMLLLKLRFSREETCSKESESSEDISL